jgi:hypothetical protein
MIESLMQLKPSQVPSDSQFLLEFDTEGLLKSNTETQHYWIAAMEASVFAGSGRRMTERRIWDSRSLRVKLGASRIIQKIREEAQLRLVEYGWVQQDTSLTSSVCTLRPTHEAASLHHGSRKKHKPD